MKKYISIIILLLSGICSNAQTLNDIYKQSIKAYEAKDFKTFLSLTLKLDSLRPSHPTFTYNLASAHALNGNAEKANFELERLVLTNNKVEFEKEPDFDILQNTEGYKKIISLKTELETSVKNSRKVVSLDEIDLHPEGLLYLSKSKIWIATSIRKKKIVSFDIHTGRCEDWFTDKNKLAVFSMKADKDQNFLWVSTGAIPEMEDFTKNMEGMSEILKVDLKTKEVVKRFSVKGNHLFGDIEISKNDVVYVSDSNNPIIYKIENNEISEWLNLNGEAFNLQGIAINNESTKMFIADYLSGIVEVSIENNAERSWLKFPKGTTKKGIDGLVFYDNSLIAIQNGVQPIRIVQYKIDKNQKKILSVKIIDNNRPEFNEPALSTINNNKLYFFANSPWKFYSKDFKLDLEKLKNPALFEYDLLKK